MVASYIILDEDLGYDRQLIRIATGGHAGMELVLSSRDIRGVSRLDELLGEEAVCSHGGEHPEAVAERLLLSLLDEHQKAEWNAHRTFWVDTKFGPVQLGRLYDIQYRPRGGESLRLCVVPEGDDVLPKSDIWTNLLLILHNDPEWFFEVANWKRARGDWHFGHVPVPAELRR